jgi:hypothetical protein
MVGCISIAKNNLASDNGMLLVMIQTPKKGVKLGINDRLGFCDMMFAEYHEMGKRRSKGTCSMGAP